MYLRDARHLDKFMYTLSDALFYEPLELHYEPTQEYTDIVAELLKELDKQWLTTRDGYWVHIHPKEFALPIQGWKIHVSATIRNGASILGRAARIALINDVPFKFALDKNILSLISSKKWDRGGSGKFITIYPTDVSCFTNLLEQLYEELHEEEGPYILSDRRYKDCKVLYYRFGGIKRTSRLEIKGEKIPVLIAPDGVAVPDIRTPYFAPPVWAPDPFPNEQAAQREITLNAGKYLVKKALGFSNAGGVYLAEDRSTSTDVVIKEARAHTLMDRRGNDAIKLLKKEQSILELLRDTGIAPVPIESFYDWENFFLVEEYVDGADIRELMLTESPLMRVNPSLADTKHFYEMFRNIFTSFARAVEVLHQHRVVFGDLSANNIKVDPAQYTVRLIDFEGSYRMGVDDPTYLYTPGFRDPLSIRKNAIPGLEDDLYGLAAIMLYTVFPIHALSSLRSDLYTTVLGTVLSDIGWSQTKIFNVINGLSSADITCARASELLNAPAPLEAPSYADDIDAHCCEEMSRELGVFILENMRTGRRDSLFPADPFVYQTNPLSVGFGACGVLYALKKCDFEVPKDAFDWLERELDQARAQDLPPGLLTGSSGVAWSLWELGFEDRAREFMTIANHSELAKAHHSYFYGIAGIGMANLFFYCRTKNSEYLANASGLADHLLEIAQESDEGIFWENDDVVHLGYGYGQSGVALFLLRLHQMSGKEKFLSRGMRALEFDLAHGIEIENGVISFPRGPSDSTLDPYIEEGSAGIAKVAMRYGLWDKMDAILLDAHRKYSSYAGLLYGLGGFVDVLTDAFVFSRRRDFLKMARRPLSGIRDVYLVKHSRGAATPGDGLLRISCDYATGIAGVMRALYRFAHLDEADFVLDDQVTSGACLTESVAAGEHGGNNLLT